MTVTSPCTGLQVSFGGATSNQRALVHATVDLSLFDFERLPNEVEFDFSSQPPPQLHNAFAYTSVGGNFDSCHKPISDTVTVLSDLDDPNRAGDEGGAPRGTWAGDKFFMETIHHELGHCIAQRFSEADIAAICACFGLPASAWSAPYDSVPWEQQVRESFAETFKDIYLPRGLRKFNNRTKHRLLRSKYEDFFVILDKICCCDAGDIGTT